MTYTIELINPNGSRIQCSGFRDTDNIAMCAARCQRAGLFREIWVYACIDGRRVRGLRYDTGFQFK